MTPRLTINYGVRWEPTVPSYDKYGRGNQFNWSLFQQGWHSGVFPTAPAGLVFNGDSARISTARRSRPPIGARFRRAWASCGIRTATANRPFAPRLPLIHDTTELFYPERWTTNSPYVSSLTLTSGQFSNPFASYVSPSGVTGDPFPGNIVFPVAGAYISIPPNVAPTYVMQWNLSYQRQVATDWLVTANYLGNASRHIWGSVDANYSVDVPVNGAAASTSNTNQRRLTYLANPTTGQYYGDIQTTADGSNGEYHALLVSVNHRMSHNVTFLVNYTWSHCVSDWDFAGELAGPVYQNPTAVNGERGNCGFDHRQNFNTSLVVTSPGLGGSFAKAITKNWQLAPIVSIFTGDPIQLADGKDISLSGQNLDRPENIAPSNVYAGGVSDAGNGFTWFNPAAFTCNGSPVPTTCTVFSGQFGDVGRDSLYGPGSINWDMAISRRFQFKERLNLDLRADFFNIMNHANWNNPGTSISSSATFGQITAFSTPREIQMALKIMF